MKNLLIISLILSTLSSYASVEGMKKLSPEEAQNVKEALIAANDGDPFFGDCNLEALGNPRSEMYINEEGHDPLVVFYFLRQYLKVSTDPAAAKITSVKKGHLKFQRENVGNIKNPVFVDKKIEYLESNCQPE